MAYSCKAFSGKGKLTSAEFVALFKKYDKDGNGHIEHAELDALLKDVLKAAGNPKPASADVQKLKEEVLKKCDTNTDGKLSMNELALMLPTEDNFLSKFRNDEGKKLTSVEFLKVWYHYDKDRSGYLESDELDGFLRDLLLADPDKPGERVDPSVVSGLKATILELFDVNKDGKIELSELSKMLPVEKNFLGKFQKGKDVLTKKEFDEIFSHYDKDRNGKIQSEELTALMKDIAERAGAAVDLRDVEKLSQALLKICDTDKDGKINRDELVLLFSKRA